MARYRAVGFEAAAVTGLAVAMSAKVSRPGRRRVATVRFAPLCRGRRRLRRPPGSPRQPGPQHLARAPGLLRLGERTHRRRSPALPVAASLAEPARPSRACSAVSPLRRGGHTPPGRHGRRAGTSPRPQQNWSIGVKRSPTMKSARRARNRRAALPTTFAARSRVVVSVGVKVHAVTADRCAHWLVRRPQTFTGSGDMPGGVEAGLVVPDTRSCGVDRVARGAMAEPVRARRLRDEEGRRRRQIVPRDRHGSVRVRRAMIIMASAPGTPVPAIARLVAADEDTVRGVVHAFNAKGLAAPGPRWAGGRPRLISDDDVEFIVAAPPRGRRSWAGRSPAGACISWRRI